MEEENVKTEVVNNGKTAPRVPVMPKDLEGRMIPQKGGKLYLQTADRVIWFRREHPDWTILNEPQMDIMEMIQNKIGIYRCTIMDSEGKIIATATDVTTAAEHPRFIQTCETGAVGRALALCGYGTGNTDDDEAGRVTDSPVTPARANHAQGNARQGTQRPQPAPPAPQRQSSPPAPLKPSESPKSAPQETEEDESIPSYADLPAASFDHELITVETALSWRAAYNSSASPADQIEGNAAVRKLILAILGKGADIPNRDVLPTIREARRAAKIYGFEWEIENEVANDPH